MAQYIDRVKLIKALGWKCAELDKQNHDYGTGCGIAKEIVEAQPIVDAVGVVRCVDCVHWKVTRIDDETLKAGCPYSTIVNPRGYCFNGKRRDNGNC